MKEEKKLEEKKNRENPKVVKKGKIRSADKEIAYEN